MTDNENLVAETTSNEKAIIVGDVVEGVVIEHAEAKAIQIESMIATLVDDEVYPAVGTNALFMVEVMESESASLSLRKAELLSLWDWIQEQVASEAPVEATVLSETRGGFALNIRGLKALLADRDLTPGRSKKPQVGERLEVRVIQYRDRKNQLIVSERALTEGSLEERKAELLEDLEVGQVLTAEVRRFANFGAFVDLGGLDALLHVKDIAWKRLKHPDEALSLGEILTVQVLEFDRETEKVSVGLKQMSPDPWLSAHETYPPSKKVKGRVVGLTKFGAFIMLDDGLEGLVHVSEMSWTEKIQTPKDKVEVGLEVDCWVLRCETDRRRLGLTLKDPDNNPWLSIREKLPIGTEGDFKIVRVVDFGLFVELDGGLDGLVHVSDFSWAAFEGEPSDLYTAGETVRAIMLDIDEERGRANLGIKQLNADLMTELMKKYAEGQRVSLTITSIQSDGFYGSIEDGLEGFVSIDNVPEAHRARLDEVYEAEQVVTAEISVHDLQTKRIELVLLQDAAQEAVVGEVSLGGQDATENAEDVTVDNEVEETVVSAGETLSADMKTSEDAESMTVDTDTAETNEIAATGAEASEEQNESVETATKEEQTEPESVTEPEDGPSEKDDAQSQTEEN